MKSNIKILLCFLFIYQITLSQDKNIYLLEIPNINYVPEITTENNGIIELEIDNGLKKAHEINQVLSSYTIYDFLDIYKNSVYPSLMNKYIIKLSPNDNLNDLVSQFSEFYPSYEEEQQFEPLYTPDDFENPALLNEVNISSYDDYEQNDLKMIRAEEAWDITKGEEYVIIGIADTGFYTDHEDLTTEFVGGIPGYILTLPDFAGDPTGRLKHGTRVAGKASASTDNGKGVSAIGFNTKMIGARGLYLSKLVQLAQFDPKPKVINLSAGNESGYYQPDQNKINMIDSLGVVVVIAGGNGQSSGTGNPNTYYYPASYENVIAVSSVGNKNEIGSTSIPYDNWKDVHDVWNHNDNQLVSHQHNDSIDLVVPIYYPTPMLHPDPVPDDQWKDDYRRVDGPSGTSESAPIVAGTIGLMFSVNYCLTSREVETILKLTAVKVDTIPENLPYFGRLGAGRLDAYEAVKMSKDMKDEFGTVEVKNRILYRPWFYKLVTAPYEIKMFNNTVTGGAKLKFRARSNIEILSGLYYPEGGYIDLQIDPTLVADCTIPEPIKTIGKINSQKSPIKEKKLGFIINPTLVKDEITIQDVSPQKKMSMIRIFDFFNQIVYEKDNIEDKEVTLQLSRLTPGIYILKIYNSNLEDINTTKIVKK